MKLTLFNKLSEFEIQILIYLTQIVVKDIVDAKISEKNYEGDLHPIHLSSYKSLEKHKEKRRIGHKIFL